MMKLMYTKLLALMLALCLLPALGGAAGETPDNLFGTRLMDAGEYIRSAAIVDDTLYILADRAVYGLRPGQDQAVKLADTEGFYSDSPKAPPYVSQLFDRDGELWGLNERKGIVYRLGFDKAELTYEEVIRLDWAPFLEEGEDRSHFAGMDALLYHGGRLYARVSNLGSDRKNDLYSYDLDTGGMKTHTPTLLYSLTPYKEGKMLALYFDQNDVMEEAGVYAPKPAELRVFDPVADTSEPLKLKLPHSRSEGNRNLMLYWDAAADQIYAASTASLMRLSADQGPVTTGWLPTAGTWGPDRATPGILPWGDKLLIVQRDNIFLRSKDESQLKPIVPIRATNFMLDSKAVTRSLMALEGITLEGVDDYFPGEEQILTDFLSRDIKVDLLNMDSDSIDIESMMKKGYLLDLGASEDLARMAETTYEPLKKLMYRDGKLYYMPVALKTLMSAANSVNFKEIGREVPTSVPELIAFVQWWADEGHISYPGYRLFDWGSVKEALIHMVNRCYIDSLLGEGKPLQYDMEVFGKYAQQIMAMNTQDIEPEPGTEELGNGSYENMFDQYKILIHSTVGYNLYHRFSEDQMMNMPLSIDGSTPPWLNARLVGMAIPSITPHPEEALRFLTSYLQNLEPRTRAPFDASLTDAIINPNHERDLERRQQMLAQQEKDLPDLEGGARREAEESIKYLRQSIERYEQDEKYILTADDLAEHRQFMAHVFVGGSLFRQIDRALRDKDGNMLLMLYVRGAISLDQFIQQANDTIRLITLESQ